MTDNASIVKFTEIQRYRLNEGETKLLKREKGVERQYRLICSHCGLWCAYLERPASVQQEYMFFIDGALSSNPLSKIAKLYIFLLIFYSIDGDKAQPTQEPTKDEKLNTFKEQLKTLIKASGKESSGIILSDLSNEYFRIFDKPLDLKYYGTDSISELIEKCKDIIETFQITLQDGEKDTVVALK